MAGDDYTRDESEAARLDRNYGELLQELRVAQTGVQILFAFLLGIAFQQRFASLHEYQKVLYVVTLVSASCSAILLIAPAAVHRMLFRRHMKGDIVDIAAHSAGAGLVCLAVAILSAVLFTLDVVAGMTLAIITACLLAVLVLVVWVLIPARVRRGHPVEPTN